MIQLGVILGYLMLLLLLGLAASRLLRRTPRDYMLASHSIGPFLLLMSLFGTTMTSFALVGSTGEAFVVGAGVYGKLASASGIVHSLCFFLVGLRLWALGRRHGYTTQIQFFRDRLESPAMGLLLFPVLVGLVIPYVLMGVIGSGFVINGVTQGAFPEVFPGSGGGIPRWMAALVICCVVLTYVFFGGMRGTAWANTFQTLVFIALGMVTFLCIARNLGGTDSFVENLRKAIADVPADHLTLARTPPAIYFSYLLIPLSVAMFPHVFQHWLTARSAHSFKLPIVVHPLLIMVVWMPCVLIGVWAAGPNSGIPAGTDPNQVLALMVQQLGQPVLAGMLTAGILAAIMSSLDSQFLCLGTIFTEDIVLHYSSAGRYSDRQTVFMARAFIVVIVAVTFTLSLFNTPVFPLGIWCFSGFTGLFPVVMAAIYWRRLTAAGAAAGIVATVGVGITLFIRSDLGRNRLYGFPENPLALTESLVVPSFHPVVAIFCASSLAVFVVSLLTRPPSDATLARFFPSREEM